VKETKEVYEGEVTELTPAETENPLSGYGKTISHVVVALKTVKGTKQLRLDPSIYESIQKERVTVGDVIYIEANTGAVKVSTHTFHTSLYSRCLAEADSFFLSPMISVLISISSLIRGLEDQMLMRQNTISKLKNTFPYRKETFTRRRRLFKMLHFTIWIWRMRDLKVDRTL